MQLTHIALLVADKTLEYVPDTQDVHVEEDAADHDPALQAKQAEMAEAPTMFE